MGRGNSDTAVDVLASGNEENEALSSVVEVVAVASFDLVTHLVFNEALCPCKLDSGGNRLSFGLGGIKICDVILRKFKCLCGHFGGLLLEEGLLLVSDLCFVFHCFYPFVF